jgi:hypothetical protein
VNSSFHRTNRCRSPFFYLRMQQTQFTKLRALGIPGDGQSPGNPFLLTPLNRVLLEKLTGFQLIKKFPPFYGTRRFITAFTTAHHLSLSSDSSIHSEPPHHPSRRSILILSSIYAWVPQVVSFPQVSAQKPCIRLFSPLHVILQGKIMVF